MHLVLPSVIEALDELLKGHGFKRDRFPPGGPRDWRRLGKRFYRNKQTSVLVVPAIELYPRWPSLTCPRVSSGGRNRRPITEDQFFAEVLRDLLETGARNVIFQGGGTVSIPKWFKSMCYELGIKIQVIGPEEAPHPEEFRIDETPDTSGARVPDFGSNSTTQA
jgi:hypothetical protein